MERMQIEYLPIDALTPYAMNTRHHSEKDIEKIVDSIERYGFSDPIGIWGNDNIIVEGHGRMMAADRLGIAEVPCIRLDHMTDEQRREYAIAHNRTAEFSDWDWDALKAELDDLDFGDFDLEFDLDDDEEETEVEEDDYNAEPPAEPKAKRGDIYQLGRHRLMCGDSTDVNDVEKLINNAKIDMIYTDPPYGMNLDTDYSSMKSKLDFAKGKNFAGGKKYDAGRVDEFHPEMVNAVLCVNANEVFMWGADYYAEMLPNKNDGSWIVWDKRANGNNDDEEDYSSDKMYGSCFELCWSKQKHKRDIARVKWAGVFGKEQEFDHKRFHPTQKPIKLSAWFVKRYSKENHNVLDLFGGSGSTLLACEELDRNCYMMEYDPRYVDVIIDRWEQYTGQKAVLLNESK